MVIETVCDLRDRTSSALRLPFDDWKLDMNYIGNSLSFQRRFEIKSPALQFSHLEVGRMNVG